MNRAVGSLGTGVSQVFRADLEALAAERLGQAGRVFHSIIDNHVHICRRPRNAKGPYCESPYENVIDSRGPEGALRRLNDGDERAPFLRHLGGSTSIRSSPPPCRG